MKIMANFCSVVSVLLIAYFGNVYCCDSSWVEHNGMCYLFSHDTQNWIGAFQMCKLLGAQLVEIETATENAYLESQAQIYAKDHFWIALTDVNEESTWKWMNSGKPLTTEGFSDWFPGQPDNVHADENCGAFYINPKHETASWQWNDVACYSRNHYICEKPNSSGTLIG